MLVSKVTWWWRWFNRSKSVEWNSWCWRPSAYTTKLWRLSFGRALVSCCGLNAH